MPPHGSAKKKKKGGRDGKDRGKRSGRGARGADHSRGVGGGSSLENLIDSGNEHLAMDRVREDWPTFAGRALVPDSADAWDAYGIALAEFGADPNDAVKVLKRAAQLSPDLGYEKFMYLGQLLDDGEAAATCTRRGTRAHRVPGGARRRGRVGTHVRRVLRPRRAAHGSRRRRRRRRRGMRPTAAAGGGGGSRVGRAFAGPGVARVLQGRNDEALEALRQSMAIWRRDRKGTAGGGDDQADDRATEFEGEYDVSFEFRFECAKLLLELDESTDAAMDVLEELLEERDDVADVWHLLALANHGCCEFDRALEMLDRRGGALRARRGAAGAGTTGTGRWMTGTGRGRRSRMASRRTWRS